MTTGCDVGRRFATAWSGGDPKRFASIFTPDCRYLDLPLGVTALGRDQIEKHHRNWLSSSSDLAMRLTSQVTDGGRVALEWMYTGTHDGRLEDMEATGRRFAFRGASFLEMDRGTDAIKVCVDYWDMNYLLGALRRVAST